MVTSERIMQLTLRAYPGSELHTPNENTEIFTESPKAGTQTCKFLIKTPMQRKTAHLHQSQRHPTSLSRLHNCSDQVDPSGRPRYCTALNSSPLTIDPSLPTSAFVFGGLGTSLRHSIFTTRRRPYSRSLQASCFRTSCCSRTHWVRQTQERVLLRHLFETSQLSMLDAVCRLCSIDRLRPWPLCIMKKSIVV